MRLYCMYDTVAEEAGTIFEARNDFMARRIIKSMDEKALPPGSTIADFRLFKLGSFDHGDNGKKPKVFGLSEAYDVTNETRKQLEIDGVSEDEYVNTLFDEKSEVVNESV